jgi:hypothetical protein
VYHHGGWKDVTKFTDGCDFAHRLSFARRQPRVSCWIVAQPDAIQKRASGNCASVRFPSKGCKEAHYPHNCAAHKAGIYRWVGRGMDDRPSVAQNSVNSVIAEHGF